mmetsp:Transcript_49518/g.99648  ORF Transcript_49518/g.99648 Transcript_49518/m.99648 type:complete len:230 (+) Transcript_49518:307-996(+)
MAILPSYIRLFFFRKVVAAATVSAPVRVDRHAVHDGVLHLLRHGLQFGVQREVNREEARVAARVCLVAAPRARDFEIAAEVLRPRRQAVSAPHKLQKSRALHLREGLHHLPEQQNRGVVRGVVPLVRRLGLEQLQVHFALPAHQQLELVRREQAQRSQRHYGGQTLSDVRDLFVELVQVVLVHSLHELARVAQTQVPLPAPNPELHLFPSRHRLGHKRAVPKPLVKGTC